MLLIDTKQLLTQAPSIFKHTMPLNPSTDRWYKYDFGFIKPYYKKGKKVFCKTAYGRDYVLIEGVLYTTNTI